MMKGFFKSMRQKQKRAVNPDIPRPNLFTHEKNIKEARATIESLTQDVARLSARIQELEVKLKVQNQQLRALTQDLNIFRKG
jgi:hypothetical protein